jgi:hypothetical protein
MRRAAVAALALALLAPVAALARTEQTSTPTFVLDHRGDADGPLDVVRVALGRRGTRRLRGEVTMRRRWRTADLGAGGSICLKLYLKAEPDAEPPEYLVCATPPAAGRDLVGRVLRNRANGLPRTVSSAKVSRPTRRKVYLRFPLSAISRPAAQESLEFSGEALTRGEDCPPAVGCVDLGPDAPATRTFRLQRDASSG